MKRAKLTFKVMPAIFSPLASCENKLNLCVKLFKTYLVCYADQYLLHCDVVCIKWTQNELESMDFYLNN